MQTSRRSACVGAALTVMLAIAGAATLAQQADDAIDWNKAQQILRKQRDGQKLTPEESSYLEKARAARKGGQSASGGAAPANKSRPDGKGRPMVEGKPSIGLTPLTDFKPDQKYKGQDGGLYGGGKNAPPASHLKAAMAEAAKIQPLDVEGRPDPNGKIVLISNGMSNTTQEFAAFVRIANEDPKKSPQVVVVDCAFGGQEAGAWAQPQEQVVGGRANPWDQQLQRLKAAGVTPQQVQAVWIKQARRSPASLGEFPDHAKEMQGHMVVILQKLRQRFANLRIAYLSSRIYAGYAGTPLNPEPYAYEGAFTMRWLIQDQIKGDAALNWDVSKGPVKAPLLLWGPYLWADGVKGRAAGDLMFSREDLAGDGTHPSDSGRAKVAGLLLKFFKTDPTARPWFVGQ